MTLDTYNDAQQLSAVREDWCRLQNHPNVDWEHFSLYLERQGSSARPWVMAVKKDNTVECIVAGRVEADRAVVDLGYWTPTLGRMTSLKILTGGVLGTMSPETAASVMGKVCDDLSEGQFDRIFICNIRSDHPLTAAALSAPKQFLPMLLADPQAHWRKTLPKDVAAFWAGLSRKHRYWLKRLAKKLDEDFPNALSYDLIKEPAQTDSFCEISEQVARKTFQRGLGVGFRNDDFFRSRCGVFAAKGAFRGYVLRLGGVPKAFWMGCVYGDTFHSEYTGYDPELRHYEIGSLLLAHIMEELVREGVRFVDFGLGSAFYKQRFGDESWEECDVMLYAPTLRNRLIAMSLAAVKQARSVAMKLPFVGRIKKVWRQHAAQQAGQQGGEAGE
ncbi:MAG: GNAT family N-acetyltransferase [Verrucomicrobia bacterium]|nr:GNAT family N-acetyltransferase [Verrucomicrobiota bacterium]